MVEWQEEDTLCHPGGLPAVPREPLPNERLCINVRNVSFPANETGRHFHVNGITVNKTTQTVESAAAVGGFHIEDVYPLTDPGRFPVKHTPAQPPKLLPPTYPHTHHAP